MADQEFLFTYGTLRKAFESEWKPMVAADLEYWGQGKISGYLYDMGDYPGAIPDRGGNEIVGDLFKVNNPDSVFAVLDEYEGCSGKREEECEFVRKRNRVKLDSGQSQDAWVYWYNRDPMDKKRIEWNDWIAHLEYKKRNRGTDLSGLESQT